VSVWGCLSVHSNSNIDSAKILFYTFKWKLRQIKEALFDLKKEKKLFFKVYFEKIPVGIETNNH
jgi:hypothetical protein